MIRIKQIFLCLVLSLNSICLAQDLTSDLSQDLAIADSADIFTEKIKIISRSGKTFILTNTNQLLNTGDFITLLFKKEGAIARAVVAKIKDNRAGIKVLKVYSLKRWKKLRRDIEVDILKGDDAKLFAPKKEEKTELEKQEDAIIDEEDLFNDKGIDSDLDSFNSNTRHIKPDSLLSAGLGLFNYQNSVRTDGGVESSIQYHFAYAYQFADNYWVEGLFAQASSGDLSGDQLFANFNTFSVRLKYTFKAPLFSFFIPYIGFHSQSVSSPEAGNNNNAADAQREENFVADNTFTQFSVGLTFLRRLVPGWFLKANLGTDIYNLGIAIEF